MEEDGDSTILQSVKDNGVLVCGNDVLESNNFATWKKINGKHKCYVRKGRYA